MTHQLPLPISRTFLLVALLFLVVLPARAQIAIDTARGVVGKEVRLPVRYTGSDSSRPTSITGRFHLSDPTVFLPERFIAPEGDSIVSYTLTRLGGIDDPFNSYGYYTFSIELLHRSSTARDTLFYLAGEALAGKDSITLVDSVRLNLNNVEISVPSGVIITRSIGAFPYVRFTKLELGVPNPARRGSVVTWAYSIDQDSDVLFAIYTLTGEEIFVNRLQNVRKGIHTQSFTIGFDIPTGVYPVRLSARTGEAYQFMHVVK